jgi:hypothetical protein
MTAPHLVELPGGDWALWRTVGLRGAGFPVTGVLDLVVSGAATSADECISAGERTADRDGFARSFAGWAAEGSERLRGIVRDARFREAVSWQNPDLVPLLDWGLVQGGARGKKRRQLEAAVVLYWQRYTTKNEAIGFFGPFGWANWRDDGHRLRVQPGPDLLEQRRVYFEGWAMEALAEAIHRDPAYRPWSHPRLMPQYGLEGSLVHRPHQAPVSVSPVEAAILAACDGDRTAGEIVGDAVRSLGDGVPSEASGYFLLDALARRGLITWGFDVPMVMQPEAALENLLARVTDHRLQAAGLAALRELEAARDGVAAAAGSADALGRALENLASVFSRLTGRAASRAHGQAYAGRLTVFEDCRRDVTVDLGPRMLRDLAPPLRLLLTSARWYTAQLARVCRAEVRRVYRELRRQTGSTSVDLGSPAVLALFGAEGSIARSPALDLTQRWSRLLAPPADASRLQYRASELQPKVEEEFAARAPGWRLARYHSPDLLVAARSVDHVNGGDYRFVLGDFHIATNTLMIACQVEQHPHPEHLLRAVQLDIPESCVVPARGAHLDRVTARLELSIASNKDFRLALGPNPGGYPKERALSLADLLLVEVDGDVVVVTRDGRLRFDVVELFGLALTEIAAHRFRLLPDAPHAPRVSIDRLTVCREAWSVPLTSLDFAQLAPGPARFLAVRRWAGRRGLPRFLFMHSPAEVKPVFLDLDCVASVDVLCKMLRAAARAAAGGGGQDVKFSEMLPAPHEAWLPDHEGARYTSELRVVALDLRGADAHCATSTGVQVSA